MSIALVFSGAWFVFFMITHNVAFYVFKKYSRAKIITNTFKISVIGFFILMVICSKIDLFSINNVFYIHNLFWECLYGLAILVSLFILYIPFYYTIATSLSVQSMIILSDNALAHSTTNLLYLCDQFTSKELIRDRLSLMIANGYIGEINEKYYLRPKGRKIANIFSKFKKIWRLGAGG